MNSAANPASGGLSWVKDVTRYQWMVFLVAWLGWMLDATDFGLFNLVLRPAVTELLGGNPTIAQLGQTGGFLSMAGLLGWALGGFAFGIAGAAAAAYIGHGMTLCGLGGILGYATFGFLADAFGRRPAIAFYNVGTMASGLYQFLGVDSWDLYPYLPPVFGYFVFGVFSGHAVYLPELFPTQVRATAVSFCNGTGRVITSFGPLIAGLVTPMLGGQFSTATAIMTCFAGLSILAMILGRDTRDQDLPHIK
ncbi:MAG: hypothetical protein EXR07_12395 [Acetobacteraceae bacterium]|nr:hypothetical protein [Acetobacteraceae bacterium]